MLGKVVVIAGAGAAAWLLRTQAAQALARLTASPGLRPGGRASETVPALVDRRPQALEDGSRKAPALLPDATPAEIALAVASEHPHPS